MDADHSTRLEHGGVLLASYGDRDREKHRGHGADEQTASRHPNLIGVLGGLRLLSVHDPHGVAPDDLSPAVGAEPGELDGIMLRLQDAGGTMMKTAG